MNTELPDTFGHGRFVVEKELGRGGMGVVYQAFDREREMRLALKTLLHMDTESLYYFKREFRELHDIFHPNLCSLIELINDDDSWFLTMELIQGIDFLSFVRNGSSTPKSLSSVFRRQLGNAKTSSDGRVNWTGIIPASLFDERRLRNCLHGLCEGLSALHAAGKVHRDIKPSNVIITDDNRVVLMDFGLISEKEIQRQTELGAIVGTAAYMAPEQAESTAVGPEADWYAVGVMLYEILTGKLPFDGHPLQIIIDKQTNTPTRPRDIQPGLPEDLETLCSVLLSRDPNKRPHPAEILNLFDAYSASITRSIATNLTELTQGELYVGREEELRILNESYQKMSRGSFETVIIEGVSGVGKSALVNNFSSNILADDDSAVILSGRCYEYESAPFKAFDGIVESLIRHFRGLSKDECMTLVPSHLEFLLRLFPTLRRADCLAEKTVSKIEVEDPNELQRRSFRAFKELLSALGKERPLVVVIDDLQWTDPDSLHLLESLVCEDNAPQMLLVILSRYINEKAESAWTWDTLFSKQPTRLHLKPLSISESTELTQIFLRREHESLDIDPELIAMEADGHPLYIAEIINHLSISRGEEWKSFRLDDAIWRRANLLPEDAVKILQIVCVAGAPMNQKHIQSLSQTRSEDFHKYVSLLRTAKFIKSRKTGGGHVMEPYHDRVRESVLAKIDNIGEAARIHLDIGRFLVTTYSDEELQENIFTVVRHLHSGRELIEDETEKLLLAELYYLAGKTSKEAAAYVSSLIFFKNSLGLFPLESWKQHYDAVFCLYCEAAEVAYILGEFELTNRLVETTRENAKSILDLAKIYEIYVLSLVADGKPLKGIDEALSMLRKLGIRLTRRPGKLHVLLQTVITIFRLFGKSKDEILSLPHTTDVYSIAARRIISAIGGVAFTYLPNLWAIMAFKLIDMSLKKGIDHLSTIAFGAWAMVNCALLKRYKDGYKYGAISLDILKQFKDHKKSGMSLLLFANFIQHWKDHIQDTLPYLLKSHEMSYRTGDIFYLAYSGSIYGRNAFFAGKRLQEVREQLEKYGKEIEQKKQELQYNANRIYYQMTLNLVLGHECPTELNGAAYNEHEMIPLHQAKNQRTNLSNVYFCKLILGVIFGLYEEACMSMSKLEKYLASTSSTFANVIYPFYDSLACLKYCAAADPGVKGRLLRRVRKNQKKFKKAVEATPINHLHKYRLVEAERCRLRGKSKLAKKLYQEAIRDALENDFIQDAALACELAADFYHENGNEEKKVSHARDALGHYQEWGAFAKVEQIKQKFGI